LDDHTQPIPATQMEPEDGVSGARMRARPNFGGVGFSRYFLMASSLRKHRTSTRSRKQGGSAAVEASLVLLVLMAMFFAMVDIPFGIFIQNTLREAVREGVRFAITQQTGSSGQDAAIESVVESYSFGFVSAATLAAGTATFTLTYYDGTTLAVVTGVGSNSQGNICVVTATVQHYWMAPVWQGTGALTFSASSSDVMEAPPGGVLPSR
jgi:Flp pilus assembly protein TadG